MGRDAQALSLLASMASDKNEPQVGKGKGSGAPPPPGAIVDVPRFELAQGALPEVGEGDWVRGAGVLTGAIISGAVSDTPAPPPQALAAQPALTPVAGLTGSSTAPPPPPTSVPTLDGGHSVPLSAAPGSEAKATPVPVLVSSSPAASQVPPKLPCHGYAMVCGVVP